MVLDVVGLVSAALGLAHLLQVRDPPPDLLLLGVEINRVLFDLVVDLVELVADHHADECAHEEQRERGEGDDAERVDVDGHVPIVPCVRGCVKQSDGKSSSGRGGSCTHIFTLIRHAL